jgi:hypothetical protein
MIAENSEPEHERSGCSTIVLIIGSSIVVTGILFFVGRWLFGGTGAYFFFYGLLLTGILGIILGYFVKKWKKEKGLKD